jgi:hypothetical protein
VDNHVGQSLLHPVRNGSILFGLRGQRDVFLRPADTNERYRGAKYEAGCRPVKTRAKRGHCFERTRGAWGNFYSGFNNGVRTDSASTGGIEQASSKDPELV